MPQLPHGSRSIASVLVVLGLAASAAAQTGQVAGVVRDDQGAPIKAATVSLTNPDLTPSNFSTTTDEAGHFSFIGLRSGEWALTASAPGFEAQSGRVRLRLTNNPPIALKLIRQPTIPAEGTLANVSARDLQGMLQDADELFNSGQWEKAITAYRAVLTKAPALSSVNLQIAAAYQEEKRYDDATTIYRALLKADPRSEKAIAGLAMVAMAQGNLKAADDTLSKAAEAPSASSELLCDFGDLKAAEGRKDEAEVWYRKAAAVDPTWGRPILKLGMLALDKGDKVTAEQNMERVLTLDPLSPEAVQARTTIDELKK